MADRLFGRCAVILLVTVGMTSIGCNVVRVTLNTPLTQEDVAFIVPGSTTVADVTSQLGAPDSLADSSIGFVTIYRFADLQYSRVNFGWLFKPWSPVDPDLAFSRTGLGTDALEVLYDSRWIVTHYSFHRHLSSTRYDPYPF